VNEEQNQQATKSTDSQSSYTPKPTFGGEGADVLRDCLSTKPWTDLNGWLKKQRPIGVAAMRRLGSRDPEADFHDALIDFIRVSETNPDIWQWLENRRRCRSYTVYQKQMRHSKALQLLAEEYAATEPYAEDGVESRMFRENLELLLRDLSPTKRRVLEAHYFDGRTYEEISGDPALGAKSVPALKSQLYRTREELQKRCIELFGSLEEARNHLGLGQGY
jgi:RNA polymerase sigma factor (sigma-70 family)